MTKEDNERFVRAVKILDAIVGQGSHMRPGYEHGWVAGMLNFLNGWLCSYYRRAKGEGAL